MGAGVVATHLTRIHSTAAERNEIELYVNSHDLWLAFFQPDIHPFLQHLTRFCLSNPKFSPWRIAALNAAYACRTALPIASA